MADNPGDTFSSAYDGGAKISLSLRQQAETERYNQTGQVDDQINKTLKIANDTITHALQAGNDPQKIAAAVQPLFDSASSLAQRVSPQYAQSVQNMGRAMLSKLQPTAATAPAPAPVTSAPLAAPQPQLSQSEVITPSQVTTANAPAQPAPNQRVAQGFDSLGGGEDTSLPSAAAPVQSTLPPAVGVGDMTPEAVDLAARQLLKGNERVLMGLGYGKQGGAVRTAIRNRAAQIAGFQNLSPDEVNQNVADFTGMKTGAQALGRREAGVTGAILGATKTLPRVLDASEDVDRTNYPDLNKIILAAKTRTGDEKVVRYGIAVNTYINNYARALGAGNAVLTDTARKEASDILQQAWSKGQIRAALNQMQLELESELQGAHEARKSFISGQQLRQETTKDLTNNPPSGQQDIQKLKEKYGLK